MRLRHKKRVWEVVVCTSLASQVRGWMFRFFFEKDGLLFVLPRGMKMDLHMFFVFRSLDILFLDRYGKVVKVYKKVKPFVPFVRGVPAWFILEVKDAGDVCVGERIVGFKV